MATAKGSKSIGLSLTHGSLLTPTAHVLEYVDWADTVIQEPLQVVNGEAVIPDRPGHGIVWDKAAVERYRV